MDRIMQLQDIRCLRSPIRSCVRSVFVQHLNRDKKEQKGTTTDGSDGARSSLAETDNKVKSKKKRKEMSDGMEKG